MENLAAMRCPSPIGDLVIKADDTGICALYLLAEGEAISDSESPILCEAARQLNAYFAGQLRSFDLPIAEKGTPFERAVWAQLRVIPYGETRTYADIADAIGRPGAARAVGRACGANPVLIITPCHRVVGAGSQLTGFAAGLDAKRALLLLEGHRILNDRLMK